MPSTLTLPEWSDTPPTVEGLYRFRGIWRRFGFEIQLQNYPMWVSVTHQFHDPERPLLAHTFGDSDAPMESFRGEWQGPIVVDEEAERG